MKQKEFKVLVMNPNTHMFEAYDILPFLRLMWEDWPYNVSFECGYVKVKTKESLKIWVQNKSVWHFWANKELEFLMAPSEFGSYKWRVDLKALIKTEPDKGKCTEDIILTKIDTKEMIQVSVHDQVKMNIDIITDILYEEFFMAMA
ncbi:MAG: hypothetical protein IKY16_04935 [Bacteroidales bacterium]|nr:hypothetical protein [Bacteroidales bacterium]